MGRHEGFSRPRSCIRRPGLTISQTEGKQIVVIGSGATAATLIPNIADKCAHVTMLQRSPTFFRLGRNAIDIVEELRRLQVKEEWIHEIVRRKIVYEQDAFTRRCIAEPEQVKKELIGQISAVLGPDFDVGKHFTPSYRPWRQRIAFVPDADFFHAVKDGKASVVTDEIERFVAGGIKLKSGKTLPADIVVTATGFNLSILGDIDFAVDGKPLDFADTVTYRGMMFTGVPNMAWVFGYFRASWTLRTDLVADFVMPPADEHEEEGREERRAGAACRRPQHAAVALDRSGEFQSELSDARHAPPAQARRQGRMAAQPGILDRAARVSRHRSRRQGVRVFVTRHARPCAGHPRLALWWHQRRGWPGQARP